MYMIYIYIYDYVCNTYIDYIREASSATWPGARSPTGERERERESR